MDLFFSFISTTPLGPLASLHGGRVSGKTSRCQELNLGMVNDGLGVFVGLHRTVKTEGLCAVRDHVDVRGLPDSRSVREVDGLVVVTHGQVPAENVMAQ